MKTVIEMAREAGIRDCTCDGTRGCLDRFAELVRADEREACAKVAALTVCDTHIPTGIKIYGTAAAKAIMARGNT